MTTTGTVRAWNEEEGWGVIDSPDTPGGCWAHFSRIVTRGYRSLRVGQCVFLDWETADQDGYAFRAISVQLNDRPVEGSEDASPADGYSSALDLTFDDQDGPR